MKKSKWNKCVILLQRKWDSLVFFIFTSTVTHQMNLNQTMHRKFLHLTLPNRKNQKNIWEIIHPLFSQIWFLRCFWIQEKSETKNCTYSFVITSSSFFFCLIFNPLEIEQYRLQKWIPCQKSLWKHILQKVFGSVL